MGAKTRNTKNNYTMFKGYISDQVVATVAIVDSTFLRMDILYILRSIKKRFCFWNMEVTENESRNVISV